MCEQVLKNGDALLKSELTQTHQMDAAAYEAVRKRCDNWLDYNRYLNPSESISFVCIARSIWCILAC